MSDPSKESPPARLFIALELPAEVRAGIACWGAQELLDPALRRLPEDALHLTLVFLGDTSPALIPRIAAALLRIDAVAPRIELSLQPVTLPPGRRPGLYALEARSEGVEEIQARLAETLAAADLHELDERPFFPHVTVARVRRGHGRRRKPLRVGDPPGRLPEVLLRPFRGVRIALYLSSFRPGGVDYTPLAQVELPPGEAAVR